MTRTVTAAAVKWLDDRGFRPIESEVPLKQGWVADVASFCYPTRTEAQKLKLLAPPPRTRYCDDPQAFADWREAYDSIPAPLTAAVEVKTSRQDFVRDKKFELEPPCHLLYLAIPRNMIALADKLDPRWGLLTLFPTGRLKLERLPRLNEVASDQCAHVIANIALRRDAFTAYERMREFDRQQREDTNGRVNRHRVRAVISVIGDVLSGERQLEEACALRSSGHVTFSARDKECLQEILNKGIIARG